MTNNKQSMKLYTEEQVRKAINDAYWCCSKLEVECVFDKLTHIELPSDEKVEEFINTLPYTKHLDDGQYNDGVIYGTTIGIEWMRDKIQGGNNDQL